MLHLWQQHDENDISEDPAGKENRLVMLCDGVFAIAITLLVLDIRLPAGLNTPEKFYAALSDLLSEKILFYFITFAVIAGYWNIHRSVMNQVKRIDAVFIWLTFLFLAFVALFPATINLITGEYSPYREMVIIYVVSLAACGFSAAALWIYASWNHRLIDPKISREQIVFRSISSLVLPIYYILSLLLLFVFPDKPSRIFLSWILIGVPMNIVQRVYRHRLKRLGQEAETVEGLPRRIDPIS
jgi:uncharacterized membrane protein